MYIYLCVLFIFSLLLSALLQRGNFQCSVMDDFRMGPFLVVVICIFFASFRVVVNIPPVILIPHGRTIILTTHPCIPIRSTDSSQQLLSKTMNTNHGCRNLGCGWGEEDEAKG